MARRSKQRSEQHIIDENAQKLLRSLVPEGWVLRNYRPDYGIDYALEVFQTIHEGLEEGSFETLGEHLFIQLKGKKKAQRRTQKIYNRYNIEKAVFVEDKSNLVGELEVIAFPLEVSELVTIQRMGAALPVILVVAELSTQKCYFICLNDYIDKILIPKFRDRDYASSRTRTIYIPTQNLLRDQDSTKRILGWYAKRAKLFAAFQKFVYQNAELSYVSDLLELTSLSQHFAKILLRYDFWEDTNWKILEYYLHSIRGCLEVETGDITSSWPDSTDISYLSAEESQEWLKEIRQRNSITQIWEGLSSLPRCYEEICREWLLPTPLGFSTSYSVFMADEVQIEI
ncbi:hypothetical protein C7293_04010 [filamentous cyanobacterium CCT1]|nr:hypothetical protein C7293_04010 [filamentous cyanobacterium CCT1]PSN77997.1 hypothetical protein C8B47_19220 [filamentous cyanobacterium CCP4]